MAIIKNISRKKITTQDFIERAKGIHGDKYDYSRVKYINSQTKIEIICKKHGSWEQLPPNHLNNSGCKKCFYESRRLTINDFINRSKKIHGDKYNYNNVVYKNAITKVIIICPEHGEFYQTPDKHLLGRGCGKCGNEIVADKLKFNNDVFFERIRNRIDGGKYYDYSLVEYINAKKDVKIICPKHGIFNQTPPTHFANSGCPKCSSRKPKKNLQYYIQKARKTHGEKYDYSKVNFKGYNSKVIIICSIHGEFSQIFGVHADRSGCPKCNESNGEKKIRIFLEKNEIEFEIEKKFKKCVYKRSLLFDFYLPDFNLCIEYDGEHHYYKNSFMGGIESLNDCQKRDQIKNKYCKDNGINLIRIPYWEKDNIENILESKLNLVTND